MYALLPQKCQQLRAVDEAGGETLLVVLMVSSQDEVEKRDLILL